MKILYITKGDILGKIDSGGLQCAYRNYDMLCKLYGKQNIIVFVIAEGKGVGKENVRYFDYKDHIIQRYINYLFLRDGIGAKLENQIVEEIEIQKPDVIFFDGSVYGHLAKKIKNKHIKKIVFCQNIERQYTWERVKQNSILCIFRYIATRYNEGTILNMADKIICLNQRDSVLMENLYHKKADMMMPISFDDVFEVDKANKYSGNGKLLFVGSYFLPNVNGVKWFAENVAAKIPYQVQIVGKGMERIKDEIKADNIEIIGGVDDLSVYYYDAEAVIMPIFIGGGMKVKTAEAMMYGKTIFATKEALEGYTSIEGAVFECNTADEFVKQLNAYCGLETKKLVNESVRSCFLDNYETNILEEKLSNLMKEISEE